MVLLPRSNPLYENIPLEKINLPEVLKKMGSGGFTGYLGFGSGSAEGYLIFIKGALISIMLLEGPQRKNGFEAFNGLFEHALSESGVINVYRLSVDLAACIHALLHGTTIMKPEPVSSIDLKATLARMKTIALNGTVQFTAAERSALIFYKNGAPIGFYHDAASEIEATPTETQKVASLPGATLEIRNSTTTDELMHGNLLEALNIDRLWQAAANRRSTKESKSSPPPAPAATPESAAVQESLQPAPADTAKIDEAVDDLQEIAKAYLGRQGAELVLNLLDLVGGKASLLDNRKATAFLAAMSAQSPDIDPEARVEEMIDLMRSEITGRLSA